MRKDLIYNLYIIERKLYLRKITFISVIIRIFMRVIFSCDIPYKAEIGKGTIFPHHALGVIIHPKAKIGCNCNINQHVTIGGKEGSGGLPEIGNCVMIGANAMIIGNIKIGNNVKIGASSVVTKSVPDNCIVAGVPAKIIKRY